MASDEPEELSDVEQDEDDEEPKLRYQRLGMNVVEELEKDEATCLAVHQKFLVC